MTDPGLWGAAPGATPPITPPPGYGLPTTPQTGNSKVPLIIGAAAGAVLLVSGGFLAGRMSAGHTPSFTNPLAEAASKIAASGAPHTSDAPRTTGITVSDSSTDAVPHPSNGKVYGPSDIVSLSVHSDGTNLVITTEFGPSTPMNLLSGGTRIRLDPDAVPSCKDSVLDSFDWTIDYDIDGVTVLKPGASCDDEFQRTSIAGVADISGSTLTIKVNQDSLGLKSGQRVAVRSCISTRIDDGHTTFIQDWAPDNDSGTVGLI